MTAQPSTARDDVDLYAQGKNSKGQGVLRVGARGSMRVELGVCSSARDLHRPVCQGNSHLRASSCREAAPLSTLLRDEVVGGSRVNQHLDCVPSEGRVEHS